MKIYIQSAEGLTSKDRIKIAKNTTNPRELRRLANDNSTKVRLAVARNLNTSPETLAQLASDNDADIRKSVAQNSNTSPETLAQLASDNDAHVRWFVVQNSNTPPEILAQLASDEISSVRTHVAYNPNTPPEILAQFVSSKDSYDRAAIAGNPNTPPEILAQLVTDKSTHVRFTLAHNPSTPPEILAQLVTDDDADVRWMALQNLPAEAFPSNEKSSTRKVPQNDWSVPLYELENYNQIAREIGQVMKSVFDKFAEIAHPGEKITYSVSTNNYDKDGEIVVDGHGTVDLQAFLAILTSSQRKKQCVDKAVKYLINNLD